MSNGRRRHLSPLPAFSTRIDLRADLGPHARPRPPKNVAPVRFGQPFKLGYKNRKWVTGIRLATSLDPERKGYWEDQGYEWFAGL